MIAPLKLFHGSLPNPEATLYTVPGGLNVVVRRLWVVNVSAGGAAVSLSIAGQRVLGAEAIAANRHLPEELAMSLAPGDTITGLTSVGGALVLLLTGFSY